MDKEKLNEKYTEACNGYLLAFCEKHGFDFRDAKKSWVAGSAGGTCLIGDFAVSFDDMKTDIDLDAPEGDYFKYYDYCLCVSELGVYMPNFAQWVNGCPRLTPDAIKSLREAKNRVYEAQKSLEDAIKEETERLNIRGYGR